ncbi:BREX-1 system adenine-specific DNA-methyltransferase PglX [Enterococcus italicus]|uniref:BREX-1 system adenine-specific DNA-methyltransferase PglX n=1 Tax=Enterococcus italicus TaxID=246144 RepID=UPI002072AF52|nr:BREX-1 system adenine-specific DNA-methyltransferase PglX [Enterococcus italicus]MCM6931603.1 BREX-1 system adenine-specific DNA-methyltransferase PglX [Enterococcus italicus]
MDELILPKIGMRTGDNARFLRQWYEVSYSNSKLNDATKDYTEQEVKWVPYNKGGSFRKWYGNYDYVVNWLDNGNEIKENTRRVYPQLGENLSWKITNESYYFLASITWAAVTSNRLSMRYREHGSIFDVAGMSAFSDDSDLLFYILGLGNSNIGDYLLRILNPTINAQVGYFKNIPVIRKENEDRFLVF